MNTQDNSPDVSKPTIEPARDAYMLRLYEKGYTVTQLANLTGLSIPEVEWIIEREALTRG